ncbi:ABC transporter permease [Embleya sp. NBC_00888]|uniref:ABC transporter permease n=1 Tax=Embleya sp. NBC_00888 TaxID=2975960 RepID=UPI0038704E4E|nr:ABC transporter permease [Embleya sp. NBC_00888]
MTPTRRPPRPGGPLRAAARLAGPTRFLARRIPGIVGVMWAAATLAFVTVQLLPGDPVDAILGPGAVADADLRDRIRREYGLDRSPLEQYLTWLSRLVTGDLGRSFRLQLPVRRVLSDQIGPTAQLAAAATAAAVVVALLTATATAGRGRVARGIASGLELVAVSVPSFWLGLVALTFLSFRHHIFPVAGDQGLMALVLPAATLALPIAGVLAQVLRDGLEETLNEPFVTALRARGAGRIRVLCQALRVTAGPFLTLAGWVVGSLFGGAVLTETVFGRPGLGRVMLDAALSRDVPVITAVMLLVAGVFVVVNTTVDVLCVALDPRLREE